MKQTAYTQAQSAPLTVNPHAVNVQDVVEASGTSVKTGLSLGETNTRRAIFGPNRLASRKPISLMRLVRHQFESPVVLLLAAAAAIAMFFSDWKEGIAIVLVLVINGTIGFVTELRAARSMEALRLLGHRTARVRRDGKAALIQAEDLVPGDVVLLEGGDIVTADLRLVETSNLSADESALTGESVAVEKNTEAVAADCPIGDRSGMAFKGTAITRGSAVGIVVGTGLQSELGQISKLVAEAAPEQSPLERQLQILSGQLIKFTLVVVAFLGVLGVGQGEDVFLMIEASVALAVAAIPEGLPVVATMALARGMWRMAKQNALIERLSAVETLGATTIIFTDKTGTLTENSMQLREINCAEAVYELSDVSGRFQRKNDGEEVGGRSCFDDILMAGLLCNNAELSDKDGKHTGDPLEQALLVAARAGGLNIQEHLSRFPRMREIAFDSTSKMMGTINAADHEYVMWVKGAPEAVLEACTSVQEDGGAVEGMTSDEFTIWKTRTDEMASRGMRVLAVAKRDVSLPEHADYSGLTFLGLLGLFDPPRADVPDAIAKCRTAGIRVIMMTGDHAVTAKNIAASVGLADHDPVVIEGRSLRPIGELSGDDIETLRQADVFARVSPTQKLELITLYQNDGQVVAMTGDGVNDAPALRQADIGVAMGLRGTQIAREAAAMVLRDDAFGSIVAAIREGRAIFRNIQRFVIYLLSCNLSEILVVGAAILVGLPLPLMPLQILFLNLVTDVFPAFALGASEGNEKILERPPRDPKKPIVTRALWIAIVLHGFSISGSTLGAFVLARTYLGMTSDAAVTVSFLTLAFAQLWHVFNMRDPRSGLIRNEVTSNKYVWGALLLSIGLLALVLFVPAASDALDLRIPTFDAWLLIFGMSLLPLALGQIVTISSAMRDRKGNDAD